MKVFISGGCKNGKSSIAEDLCVKLVQGGPLYYIATMQAWDDEDRERIRRHRKQREGKGFETIEQPNRISEILKMPNAAEVTFLLDSVTALLINELYGLREDQKSPDKTKNDAIPKRVADELVEVCKKVKNIVLVSDYIYMEKDRYSEYTLQYMEALSIVDKALAKECDLVCEVFYGNVEVYKGEFPLL